MPRANDGKRKLDLNAITLQRPPIEARRRA